VIAESPLIVSDVLLTAVVLWCHICIFVKNVNFGIEKNITTKCSVFVLGVCDYTK